MNERLKEIKESLNMNCSDMTWCVETITDLIETIEQQQEEVERLTLQNQELILDNGGLQMQVDDLSKDLQRLEGEPNA